MIDVKDSRAIVGVIESAIRRANQAIMAELGATPASNLDIGMLVARVYLAEAATIMVAAASCRGGGPQFDEERGPKLAGELSHNAHEMLVNEILRRMGS